MRGLSGRLSNGPAPPLAAAAAIATLAAALWWGTHVAGGSDSYCYVSQSELWLNRGLLAPQPTGFTPPWPNAAASLTPTGYIPSPLVSGGIAPLCPAGLSLTMALLSALGGPWAAFLVVPLLAGLGVWLAFCLGRALEGPATGLVAAILVASSPIVLYQAMQPMSDVPAMTWWLAALVLIARPGPWRAFGGGLAAAAAVLTRPNLAPLAFVLGLFLLVRPAGDGPRLRRLAEVCAFALGLLPGVALVAWIQQVLYGSPLSSGYGSLRQLFSWSHVTPNLQRFPSTLVGTHTPAVILGLVAPFLVRGRQAAWLASLCLVFATSVLAAYVAYVPYEEWWYLRFLLPGVPPLLVLTASALIWLAGRLPARARTPVVALCTAGLAVVFLQTAIQKNVFQLHQMERRFRDAGQYVGAKLPERAVVLAVWQTGGVRHYGRRLSVTFDEIPPDWLDRAVAFLQSQGRPPYLLLEAWEEPAFRERFAHSQYGALDWPPMAEIGTEVRLYCFADRARYYAGEPTPRERVWPGRRPR